MKNKVNIKQFADVIAGYTFRTALKEQGDGDIFVLQAKNIREDTGVDEVGLNRIAFENYRTAANIQKGDVVISSRGNFRAGVVRMDLKNIIAASSVYILRINTPDILPDYLALYLNSSVGQKIINEQATGVVINTILKKNLENLVVTIPKMEVQKKIISLYQNNKKLEKLLNKKKVLINKITEDIINTQ